MLRSTLIACLLSTTSLLPSTSASAAGFERVPELEPNVRFWRKVYAVWTGNDIALHDREDLSIVYRVVRVPSRGKRKNGKNRSQTIAAAKGELIVALKSLAKKKPTSCTALEGVEKEVCQNLAAVTRKDKYTRPTSLIRAQNGLYARSRRGWVSFGRYEKDVRRELRKAGLPEELIALAFLESLYNIRARSSANAVGMWQFLKGTARDYMHVNALVDERVDPVLATESATKYIKQSRKRLGAWPLAITSYNIGRAGMARGVRATGSKDLGVIVKKYKKRSFGFAAKNYYATFIALQDVIENPDTYFPGVKRAPSWRYDVVRLPFDATVPQLIKYGAIEKADLEVLNPALTREARAGKVIMPRGFSLRVKRGNSAAFIRALKTIPVRARQRAQLTVRKWTKANGTQSVKVIARRFRVDAEVVAALAGLRSDDVPDKGTPIPIPSGRVKSTLFPEARGKPVPQIGKPIPAPKIAKIEPPKDLPDAPPDRPPVVEKGPRVKLVRVRTVKAKALNVLKANRNGPLVVDVVAGAAENQVEN